MQFSSVIWYSHPFPHTLGGADHLHNTHHEDCLHWTPACEGYVIIICLTLMALKPNSWRAIVISQAEILLGGCKLCVESEAM